MLSYLFLLRPSPGPSSVSETSRLESEKPSQPFASAGLLLSRGCRAQALEPSRKRDERCPRPWSSARWWPRRRSPLLSTIPTTCVASDADEARLRPTPRKRTSASSCPLAPTLPRPPRSPTLTMRSLVSSSSHAASHGDPSPSELSLSSLMHAQSIARRGERSSRPARALIAAAPGSPPLAVVQGRVSRC